MSSRAQIFLALSALLWLPYGLYCLFVPGALAESAGVAFRTPTGSTELRAMYGGLQAALGAFAWLGAVRPAMTQAALLAIGFATAGLFSARLLGLALDGGFSSYTGIALAFELASALLAFAFWRRGQS